MERDNSIAGLLKADLQEQASHKEVFIRIPGFDQSGIQIKYRLPEGTAELDHISTKVERETKDRIARNLRMIMDTIILLCEGVYYQTEAEETPQPLDIEGLGEPCLIDERLAGYLGMNGDNFTAREVVRVLFGGNEFAIISHGEKLQRWMIDQSADITKEFWQLGE